MWRHFVYCVIEVICFMSAAFIYKSVFVPNPTENELAPIVILILILSLSSILFHSALYNKLEKENEIYLKFKRLKKFIDIAPEKYQLNEMFVIYKNNPNAIPMFIYFPTIIDWIQYMIYRHKNCNTEKGNNYLKAMNIYRAYMHSDLEESNKKFEEMIKNLRK